MPELTDSNLNAELQRLRQRVAELERADAERKKTEAAQNQALILQSILESMKDGVAVADTQGKVVLFNPAASRIIESTASHEHPEEWASAFGIFKPDKKTLFTTEELPLMQALRGEPVDDVEQFLRTPEKPEGQWLITNGRPLRDQQGNLLGGVVVFRDITPRKREIEALRDSEERFRRFMDNSPAVAFMKDEQGRYVYYNEPHCQFFGHQADAWLGKSVYDVFPAEVARKLHEHDQEVMASDRMLESHELVPAPDGTPHEWLAFKFPVQGPGGRRYLGGVAVDITTHRKAERALKASEERFRTLSVCSPVGIFLTDTRGECTYINPRCVEICGLSLAECQGMGWANIVHPDDRNEVAESWLQAARSGSGFTNEYRFRTPTGSFGWARVQTAPMFSDDGQLTGHIGTFEDITSRKETEAQLQDYTHRLLALSRRLLEVQEQERRHLARELHDEIGQLLTGLKLTLEMTARGPAEERRSSLERAQMLVRDLTARVRDLSLHLRPTMLDDLGLLPALLWHLERYTAQTQVQVHFEKSGIDRRFPPEVETAAYRIVQEALTNVARHSGVQQATLRIWLDEATLYIQVEDNGVGFDADTVVTASTSSGLSGMHERVSLLNGRLHIEAHLGLGTRILAELPMYPSEVLADQAPTVETSAIS